MIGALSATREERKNMPCTAPPSLTLREYAAAIAVTFCRKNLDPEKKSLIVASVNGFPRVDELTPNDCRGEASLISQQQSRSSQLVELKIAIQASTLNLTNIYVQVTLRPTTKKGLSLRDHLT